ncbi:MAG TPA: asparagine synthase (glutamine-hydrolyzing), partial [Phycisphaerae bacterium]|nr:asparagine synthase (glutamine-hydrolyzing) [Phycisphaerae bacterium]
MCGIAGLIVSPPDRVDRAFVPLALRKLAHRGPDDHGCLLYWRSGVRPARDWRDDLPDAEAALVHRRLSIIDLTEAGRQPMGSADGRYYIVFNGEIYNYVELREELEGLGHTFRSRSDTEVLLTACARWGTAALPRLVGMFAFAILDTRERRLLLARDFFGIKPLYYVVNKGRFAFASELKVLLEFADRPRRINPERLYQYLRYGYTDHGGETFLKDVRQVPPAHYLQIRLDKLDDAEPVRYWDVDPTTRADVSFEQAARRTRELFLENMRLHLRSDVPVGTALSGGIDSSAIVMAMRQLGGKDLDLHTFSYVADDEAVSEERWVDVVTEAAGAVTHKVRPVPEELLADLDALIYSQDEPFGSTRIYAQYRVFRLAREAGIKVMLDGQGADEILGGYRFYLAARLASLIRQGRWVQVITILDRWYDA